MRQKNIEQCQKRVLRHRKCAEPQKKPWHRYRFWIVFRLVRGSDPRTLQQASSQDRLVESMATLVQGHSVGLPRSGCYRLGLTILCIGVKKGQCWDNGKKVETITYIRIGIYRDYLQYVQDILVGADCKG